jgi:hypothetical protein
MAKGIGHELEKKKPQRSAIQYISVGGESDILLVNIGAQAFGRHSDLLKKVFQTYEQK